jgi:aminocarboxymuconate-semialdehyde decarboxylase
MLIDLHGHHLTKGMFHHDDYWGPFFENGTLRIGDWVLGTTRNEDITLDQWIADRWSLDVRTAQLDAAGVDKLVVSMPAHMYLYWTEPDFNIKFAHAVNEDLAAFCAQAPDRFGFWAHTPMQDPAAAVKELEHGISLGAVGLQLGAANFGGREFDDEAFFPLWEKLCELDVPIFVHGYNQSATWGKNADDDRYDTTSIVGMCYDEARCFWYLVNGGVLDRFPDLKVYITHAGGYVPYQIGRFDATNKTMAPDSKNAKPIYEYMPNFWFDPLVEQAPMRRAIVDVIGVDRLLYGDNFGGADSIDFDLTEGIGLSEADREKIRSGNAKKLLKL